ncbi:MAG: tRNA (N6-isopentenyl adenosine(37)-C2)-methylthiotransferase MiaB [Sphaerochaetaceae bacterium]|nr:tRNA (N6-isopentenyl adenosine(37)-C2)-methylthiotransferase MiaB [Sphaerochaetaceae bacterium]MDD4219176.1 tRNA (N6-isopentenyl adenosine(37)-C2)-methylthiotransferase MiaB [Sphaerochaetaceae bacterium]
MSKNKVHSHYWLETYGCQMNTAESNALEAALQAAGMQPAAKVEEADCAILNTCSVRKTAETRIWGRIGYFKHLKETQDITLVITGCMAERVGDDFFKEAPTVDHVWGTNDKQRIAALLTGSSDERDHAYTFTQSYYKPGSFTSYVPIMNGCDNFCTYCIVPYVRGQEVSRDPQSIYAEIAYLEEQGVREITLLGQNVNSYDYTYQGKRMHFPDLLSAITERVTSLRWIRFESPHPKDFSQELIQVIAKEPTVAKHLHIPVQSGSTKILKQMNRHYSREQYLQLVTDLRTVAPSLTLTTDVMVGFPGETDEDFQQTLSLMKEVGFLEAFMYYFNPREGTAAVDFHDQLSSSVKMERLQKLIALQRSITLNYKKERCVGDVEVLVEQVSKRNKKEYLGRTEHGEMVVFEPVSELTMGEFTRVTLHGLAGNTYKATHNPQ